MDGRAGPGWARLGRGGAAAGQQGSRAAGPQSPEPGGAWGSRLRAAAAGGPGQARVSRAELHGDDEWTARRRRGRPGEGGRQGRTQDAGELRASCGRAARPASLRHSPAAFQRLGLGRRGQRRTFGGGGRGRGVWGQAGLGLAARR